jgi:hypothetical protein
MTDKSKMQRKSNSSRDHADDNSRDTGQSAKGTSASNNIEGWLRSKELQPPG